ncbi:DNA-directed RNA polymerase subunit alpha C-terminal domain-containing protein [Hyphomicrobium sp.]|uniref:DNA-directed RNA polymerase subunit alpha C-terminal domain-containing protein n=1 Tax=Hyphomicrobium sp. TaxID=82 RepID=UPI003FA5D598
MPREKMQSEHLKGVKERLRAVMQRYGLTFNDLSAIALGEDPARQRNTWRPEPLPWKGEDGLARQMTVEGIYRLNKALGVMPAWLVAGEGPNGFDQCGESGISWALSEKVSSLPLSPRPAKCLADDDIVFIGELVQKTESELLRMPNFGRKCLNEVKECLAVKGLYLGMETHGWHSGHVALVSKK